MTDHTTKMPPHDFSLNLAPQLIVKIWQQPQDYVQSYEAMKAFTAHRTQQSPEQRAQINDELWILSHPSIYTLGQAGLETHLLEKTDVPIIRVDRGGQVTYHGAGQIIIYCLIDLKRLGLYVRDFVHRVEAAIIACLNDYGLQGLRYQSAPGIYLHKNYLIKNIENSTVQMSDLAKIAALGLKISNGCSYHGLALNVDVNLKHFSNINPCGYEGLETIDMKKALALKADAADLFAKLPTHTHDLSILAVGQNLAKHSYEKIYK